MKAPDEYQYFKENEKFSTIYLEEFLSKLLENELIPDIFMDVLNEMTDSPGGFNDESLSIPLQSDIFVRNTQILKTFPHTINSIKYDGTELVSAYYILSSLAIVYFIFLKF